MFLSIFPIFNYLERIAVLFCMEILQNYIWDQNQRPVNEDAMGFRIYEKGKKVCSIAVVCDGIAGLSRGEFASSYLTRELLNSMDFFVQKAVFRKNYIRKYFFHQIYCCDQKIKKYSRIHHITMGTTMSMLIIVGNNAYLFQLGDSSIYGGIRSLKKLSAVHSKNDCLRRAVGVGKYENPFFKTIKIRHNDCFLLCSDGFDRKNRDNLNHLFLRENTEAEIKKRLLDLCVYGKNRGETDNITAIFLKVLRY